VTVRLPSAEQRASFETAVSRYQLDLQGDTSAQAYLEKRGIGPLAAASFRLGVVRTPITGHETYRGRLAIPYLTPAGPVNLRFRCLRAHDCKTEGCPKYLSAEGAQTNLFNVLDLKKPSPFICVAEGEIDAMTLSMSGLPAVGVPGVENWEKHFSRCLDDFDKVFSFADPDKAGRKFASFLAREVRAVPVRLPEGEDVNSLYVRSGADALRKLIQA
jgi:DNA primase